MKQYSAYLFDLYGTLADIHTDENKAGFWKKIAAWYCSHDAAWNAAGLRAEYLRLCAAETARLEAQTPGAAVEIDLQRVFCALYTEKNLRPDAALLADTAWAFRQASTTHLRAYAGAGELLDALRATGRQVILLSNAQSCFTRPELKLLGLAERFDRIYISSEIGFRKPDPRFFSAPLRELGLAPEACVMIGNDPRCDIGGAAALGIDGVYLHSALSPRGEAAPGSAVLSLPQMNLKELRRRML